VCQIPFTFTSDLKAHQLMFHPHLFEKQTANQMAYYPKLNALEHKIKFSSTRNHQPEIVNFALLGIPNHVLSKKLVPPQPTPIKMNKKMNQPTTAPKPSGIPLLDLVNNNDIVFDGKTYIYTGKNQKIIGFGDITWPIFKLNRDSFIFVKGKPRLILQGG